MIKATLVCVSYSLSALSVENSPIGRIVRHDGFIFALSWVLQGYRLQRIPS